MSEITRMFNQRVDGWPQYAPTDDRRTNDHRAHQIMSGAVLAIPEPLTVTGTTHGEGTYPLDIAVLGQHLTAHICEDDENTHIDVYPNSSLEQVRIDSSVYTTSGVMGVDGSGSTQFSLKFSWGWAEVTTLSGTEDERKEWLEHFLRILAEK